jgi:hypothetical protein
MENLAKVAGERKEVNHGLPDWLNEAEVKPFKPSRKTKKDQTSITTIWRNGAIWRENKECAIQLKDLKPIP